MAHEFDGKKYEKASAHQKEWGAKVLADLALNGDERILDLGCGDGTITALIAGQLTSGHVVGIDASQGMIDAAKPKETPNLRFILMDIEAMDFSNTFDVIYSNAALHWVKDHHRLLGNCARALREDGILRFNFAADGNCSHFYSVICGAMKKVEFSHFFDAFSWPWYMPSIEEYTRLVGSSRLEGARIWGENADRFFPDTETMIAWLDQPSLVPFLASLPESHKGEFREYVIAEMIQQTRQADGRCFETFRRINLFAGKQAGGTAEGRKRTAGRALHGD